MQSTLVSTLPQQHVIVGNWSKTTGGRGRVFEDVVVRKHMAHPFHLVQNRVSHPYTRVET